MNTASMRISHVLVAGLTLGILAGLTVPLVDGAASGSSPPSSEPVEPSAPTTEQPMPAIEATESTGPTAVSTTTMPATTSTTSPATTTSTTTVPATTSTTTVPATTSTTTVPSSTAPAAVPSVPVWVSATPGNMTATLQWLPPGSDGGSPILDYVIEQRLADTSEWAVVDDGVDTGTSATVTGLTNGTAHHFRIHAVNQDGPGGVSEEITATPRTVPGAPLSMAAVPTNVSGQIRLTWTAPPDGGSPVTDYIIHRSPNGTSGWTLVGDGVSTATTFVAAGLSNCTRYYFRVYAANVAGTGPASSIVSTISRGVPTAPRSLVAAPTNASGQVRLTWVSPLCDGGSTVTDYVIQRSPNGTTGWVTISDGVSTAAVYTVSGLVNGTRYYFRVHARNALGTSLPSNLTSAIPRTMPSAPRSLTAAATGASGQIRLAWYAPVSNGGVAISDYVIQRSPNGTTGWVTISDGVSTASAYTVTGLTNGSRYYFRVYARNAVGTSGPSNVANAIPRYVLTAPRTLIATPTNLSGQVRLTWTVPLSNGGRAITDYVIQRSPNGSTGWATITDGVNVNTAFTVTGLSNGVRYHFRVYARTGTVSGPGSNIVNAIPRIRPTAPRSLVAAPTNLSGQVRLTWLAPASNGGAAVTDYIIQRSPNGTSWATIGDGVSTATSYTAFGLINGTRYYFRVFARNAAGTSTASNAVSAIPRTVPSQPSSFFAEADADGFYLEWGTPASTGGSPITGYLIQQYDYDAATWETLGTTPPTWRWVFIDQPGEGCGAFRMAAVNAAGRGPLIGPLEVCWP